MSSNPSSPRARSGTATSMQSATRSVRSASERFMDSNLPLGMWAATATATSTAPTLGDIRRGSFSAEGWNADAQMERAGNVQDTSPTAQPQGTRRPSSAVLGRTMMRQSPPVVEENGEEPMSEPFPDMTTPQREGQPDAPKYPEDSSKAPNVDHIKLEQLQSRSRPGAARQNTLALSKTKSFPNGYIPPPKVPWTTSTAIGLAAFWKWFLTPFGFLITLYGLNVVAWGGMLFLLLLSAAPAMCNQNTAENHYDGCNDINSPRRIWLEIDSQILNALFCVTGFGLIPWRFRDLYWLMRFRFTSEKKKGRAAKMYALRKLAGINSGWLRLPGSDTLDELNSQQYLASIGKESGEADVKDIVILEAGIEADANDERLPLPLEKTPAPPLTGVRAPPTRLWLLDFVIWANVWNTFFQACLCGFMWGLNRYNRPSWSTGLFIALGCCIAGAGGIVMFVQGKRVKRVEGVAPNGANASPEAIGVAGEENAKS